MLCAGQWDCRYSCCAARIEESESVPRARAGERSRDSQSDTWHHDQPYWTVDGNQVCTTWVALDPVPAKVALEFVAGSHLSGQHYRPRHFLDDRDYDENEGLPVPDINANRDGYRILNWVSGTWDCLAFHARTLHAAPGNTAGTHRRRAVAFLLTGDDAHFALRKGRMSPPFSDVTLSARRPYDSETFPIVWPPEKG